MEFKSIINEWPNVASLAADLHRRNRQVSVEAFHHRINKWQRRNKIPAEYWADFLSAAEERGIKVDHNSLMRAAQRKAA